MYLFGLLCLVASSVALPAMFSDSSVNVESQNHKLDLNEPRNIANNDESTKIDDYKGNEDEDNKSEFQISPVENSGKIDSKEEKDDKVDEKTEPIPDLDFLNFISFLTSMDRPQYLSWPFFIPFDFDIDEFI
ncbi:unnamed protein product [Euphydryas editha]|uniref:Uncharacterized protein n=1 Tax=Euphydryas editha TaxID=104508 RepID=A0AAU9VDF5_EUPED|nr:unnamed protein product [Euphydryas editha]